MPATRELRVRQGQVLLMVGTMKGVFLFASNTSRQKWEMGGPHFAGSPVYALAHDARNGQHRMIASVESPFFGTTVRWSDDLGRSWTQPAESTLKFPTDTGVSLKRVWQFVPIGRNGTIYAGVEPTALFVSRDRGGNWELVRGLFDHPHRPRWEPGNGGQCLHTILPDPKRAERMLVAMSTGGVYRTDDGGAHWQPRNVGVRAEFRPDKYPEFGQCVHKVVRHPARPDTLFLQNHWGLYRSDDGADSWRDVANGVPSDFGFCMAIHPHDPDVVYIVPLESDGYRCTPEGKMRVYRTRNGGKSWEPLTNGLPQKNAHETVLRDALTVDALNPAGVYFGTRSGKLYASPDGGASWKLVSDGLPQVLCVRAAVIGEPSSLRVPASARSAAASGKKGAAPVKPTARKVTATAAKPAAKRAATAKAPKPAAKKTAKPGAGPAGRHVTPKPGGARPKRAR
ncbi:MAG TPA: exo-alpha-sialidase [Candidatus Eisenbacteria bacterium]|jgi:photosystem II stability/assembly factor-like uncharacterized protein